MDGLKMLEEDHRRVDVLFGEFEEAGDQAFKTKRGIVDKVIEELTVHAEMEERVLYPTAKEQVDEAEENVLESEEEHRVVHDLLNELKAMRPEDELFDARVTVLIENVRHHVEEEEGELFPKIRKAYGPDELEALGERMAEVKRQMQG
jgi:hemerythrin superfamily protein